MQPDLAPVEAEPTETEPVEVAPLAEAAVDESTMDEPAAPMLDEPAASQAPEEEAAAATSHEIEPQADDGVSEEGEDDAEARAAAMDMVRMATFAAAEKVAAAADGADSRRLTEASLAADVGALFNSARYK